MLRLTLLLVVAAIACQAAPASDDEAADYVVRSVSVGDYVSAISQCKELLKDKQGPIISKAVDKLIEAKEQKVFDFAYQLWSRDSQDIVKNYFPLQFRSIFSQLNVKLVFKRDGMAIKLGKSEDSYGDREAFGDSSDLTGGRVTWKIMAYVSDSKLYFKIYNTHYDQFLKLGTSTDSYGDYTAYGSTNSDHSRHLWYIQPAKFNNEVLFLIYNRAFDQALKLSTHVDSDGDRTLFGHNPSNGNPTGHPEYYGWVISTF